MKNKILNLFVLTGWVLGFFINSFPVQAADADIIITEIGAYETADYEWVEIYNKGNEPVDLTNWKFYEDLTNHRLTAWQNDLIIDPGEYAIIANKADLFKQKYVDFNGAILDSSWSSLREDGEEIGLKNSASDTIESFIYQSCPNTSLQRIDLNLNDYTAANWQVHETGNTAGYPNQFPGQNPPPDNPPPDEPPPDDPHPDEPPPDEPPPDNPPPDQPPPDNPPPDQPPAASIVKEKIISSGTVVINEFVSDPADGEVEWLELYNKNNFEVDLTGWKIIDGSESETALSGAIGTNFDNKFLAIESPKGKLNNSGDAIILKDKNNNTIDCVYYGNWASGFTDENAAAAQDPNSTARIFDGLRTFNSAADFAVTQTPTKGAGNFITLLETEKIKLEKEQKEAGEAKTKEQIIINEIYPNPAGSDLEAEWLEVKNTGEAPIDLLGWQIQDASKKKYKIAAKNFVSTLIKPGEYFIINRKISGLALNNDKDTIKLISAEDKTIETIKYSEEENVPENASYALDEEGNWFWTTTLTENQANIITRLNHAPEISADCPKTANINETITCDASDSFDFEDDQLIFTWEIEEQAFSGVIMQNQFPKAGTFQINLQVSDGQIETKEAYKIKVTDPNAQKTVKASTKKSSAKTVKKTTTSKAKKTTAIISTDLSEARKLAKDTKIKSRGIVSVLPDTFGKTVMYLAGSGIQVYMSKANWPKLQIGDEVEITGTLGEAYGETRIKLASQSDIKVLANQAKPEPKIIKVAEIGEPLEGYLVQFSGQLLEKNGAKFSVKDETGEALVYIKTNTKITKTNFLEGDQLKVTGIVSQNNEQYQILPRSNDDLQKILPDNQPTTATIEPNKQSQGVLKYLVATALFLMLGLATVVYQKKKGRS